MNMTSRYKKIRPISSYEMAERIPDNKTRPRPPDNDKPLKGRTANLIIIDEFIFVPGPDDKP